ncbi:MAG: hypothetical protein SV775_18525 [Thermodesulfobacteriota bacterium]|nr:hypothetical protein [Thermodesulfobacteriota bacterium]
MIKHLVWCLLILCLATTVNANSDKFIIGVSFSLSNGGAPDLSSIRPWVDARINEPTPNGVNRFRAGEMHHLYVGMAVFASGYLFHSRLLRVVGGVLIIDDTMQHLLRVDSPIHMSIGILMCPI